MTGGRGSKLAKNSVTYFMDGPSTHYNEMLNNPIFLVSLLKTVTLSTETVLSSNSFHKSTTLALKNFCPNVPFLFLNNLYLCPRVPLLGANSKNLSHCIDSFPVIIL